MNILGVGAPELILIFIIMLIVAGPKRMIRWAYFLGVYIGKFRLMWSQVVDVVQNEITEAGIDVQLPKEPPTRANINQWTQQQLKPFSGPLEDAMKEFDSTVDQAKTARKDVKQSLKDTPRKTNQLGSWSAPQTSESTSSSHAEQDTTFGTWGSRNGTAGE